MTDRNPGEERTVLIRRKQFIVDAAKQVLVAVSLLILNVRPRRD